MAREPSKAWQMYLVRADGSALTQVLSDGHNEADPTWSPDSKSLIFGGVPDLMGKEDTLRTIRRIDLQTHAVEILPNSEDLFSPRWSVDGRYVVAMTLDQRSLMLFDMTTKSWRQLAKGSFADPVWASDGRSIFTHGFMEADQPIRRVSLDGRVEVIASLANARSENVVDYFFCGLMPGDIPAVRTRSGAANLYSLDIRH
jgi:Tol biopolymer transport system component